MTLTEAGARTLAVLVVVGGLLLATAAFMSWYGDAQQGYPVDDDGPLAAVLDDGAMVGAVVIAQVLEDDCAEAVVVAPETPAAVYEPVVGNADSDVGDSEDRVLVVVFDDLGSRIHAEHVSAGAIGTAEPIRRLGCERSYTRTQLAGR